MSHKNKSFLSLRWKEHRMCVEIYREHLKHIKTSSNGASLHGSNETTIELDEQTPSDHPARNRPSKSIK
jgi:hypothetical protein